MNVLSTSTRVIFMGTPQWAVPSLEATLAFPGLEVVGVYSQPDRRVGRKGELQSPPVAEYTKLKKIPLFQPETFRSPEIIETFQQLNSDIVLVCAYGKILPQVALDFPIIGCFNLHFSFLPRWRGASPIQAAILAGDVETGVSLQKMVLALDAGPLVAMSDPEMILPEDSAETLGNRLSEVSRKLIFKVLPDLQKDSFSLDEQNPLEASYCRVIPKEAGHIHWNEEGCEMISRKKRAYTPWPGVYSFLSNGKRLQFNEFDVLPHKTGIPGIIQARFMVGCQTGSILVKRVTLEGKPSMTADDFLRGYSHVLGSQLQ